MDGWSQARAHVDGILAFDGMQQMAILGTTRRSLTSFVKRRARTRLLVERLSAVRKLDRLNLGTFQKLACRQSLAELYLICGPWKSGDRLLICSPTRSSESMHLQRVSLGIFLHSNLLRNT